MEEFIKQFELLFDETAPGSIQDTTNFKDLDEWSSLIALSVIAMVDEQYNYKLTNEDFRNSVTVRDLFSKIKHE